MGISYQQTCKNGPCWMCSGKGVVVGNGTALTNPVVKRAVPTTGPLWEAAVRAVEDAA